MKYTMLIGMNAIAFHAFAVVNVNSCREITAPGSYRVVQDLVFLGTNLQACISIKASDVTIDLQGHTIRGNGTGIGKGIEANELPLLSNIEIQNGSVRAFRSGIFLNVADGARVERMRVMDNSFEGILVSTQGSSIVIGNMSTRNPRGIFVSGHGLVFDNNASANITNGIELRGNGVARGNVANANGANGISVRCPAMVIDNIALENRGGDLRASGTGCRLSGNLAPTFGN